MGLGKTLALTLREMGKPESSGKREGVMTCWHSAFYLLGWGWSKRRRDGNEEA